MDNKIVIKDNQDLIEISFDDIKKYHGYGFIALAAVTFKAMQAAFEALFPDRPPSRTEIRIHTGHPGQGVRDAFEMVTRAVTRNAYTIDTNKPTARLNPNADISYSFDIISDDGTRAEIDLRVGILPNRFFELFKAVRKVPNSTEEKNKLDNYKQEFDQLKRTLAAQILDKPLSELFIVRVIAP
jgi:hypothetical protein